METETRITTAPYREAGVQDANTRLEQRAKQRMTHKPPMKLLSPKGCVKIGQWNIRTFLDIFSLDMSQISSNLLKKAFATWQHVFLSTTFAFRTFLLWHVQ